jgi:hypothetical protein
MTRKLLLVDRENKHKVDLSPLDESFRAIIFVGTNQKPPRLQRSLGVELALSLNDGFAAFA